jgi:hypothetical protein
MLFPFSIIIFLFPSPHESLKFSINCDFLRYHKEDITESKFFMVGSLEIETSFKYGLFISTKSFFHNKSTRFDEFTLLNI